MVFGKLAKECYPWVPMWS